MDLTLIIQTVISGIGTGIIYGLIGIGFCVIYNASGIVNFAQGMFVMLGGMVTHALLTRAGLPLALAIPITILLAAALGIAVDRLVVQPLWRRNATMFVMILATLAAQIVVERATLMIAGDQPRTFSGFTSAAPWKVGGVAISPQLLWIAGASLFLVGALALFFKRTRTGRAMRACAINREAAALQGIPVAQMLALSFALSAALGAIAGILITPTQYTAFNVGVPFAISGFIAAILGGFGNAAGAFAGGIMLGVAQALAIVFFGAGFKNVAALSILLVFLLARPQGLFGKAH
ncbi:MAG: branched-chain amino acid ABC transporter permease [Betaproteobacteria bacterium]|nr:branched-chain amino acid ABC transporter permease [Betaproteobacteria bacterium]